MNLDNVQKKGQNMVELELKFSSSSIEAEDLQNQTMDDAHVRRTRSLSDVYERCNIVVC